RPDALAGWLYGAAVRVTLAARRIERRRATEPRRPALPARDPLDELTAREFLAIRDTEIALLLELDRAALVLCCLQGLLLDWAAVPDAVAALLIAIPRPRIWLALLIGIVGIGIGWIAIAKSPAPQPPALPAKPAPERLPPGVVARLGVSRQMLGAPIAFAPD